LDKEIVSRQKRVREMENRGLNSKIDRCKQIHND